MWSATSTARPWICASDEHHILESLQLLIDDAPLRIHLVSAFAYIVSPVGAAHVRRVNCGDQLIVLRLSYS